MIFTNQITIAITDKIENIVRKIPPTHVITPPEKILQSEVSMKANQNSKSNPIAFSPVVNSTNNSLVEWLVRPPEVIKVASKAITTYIKSIIKPAIAYEKVMRITATIILGSAD